MLSWHWWLRIHFLILEVRALVQIPHDGPSRGWRSNFFLHIIGRYLFVARKPQSTPVVMGGQCCWSSRALLRTIIFGIFDVVIYYMPWSTHQTLYFKYRLALVLLGRDKPGFEVWEFFSASHFEADDKTNIISTWNILQCSTQCLVKIINDSYEKSLRYPEKSKNVLSFCTTYFSYFFG